jgi:ADP-dependent NAD(P)H-hydrate dehydratase / NAD(P)H-hydrate epimerase
VTPVRLQPVLTPDEMTAADRRTIAAGTPVETLMDRAGRAVAWAVRTGWQGAGTYGHRAVIVVGKGNNGGDGLVAARVLEGWGVHVDLFHLEAGIDRDICQRALQRADVVIDAMFGTGFKGALDGDAEWFAQTTRAGRQWTVAIDIPSGVNGLTGEIEGEAVFAQQTVCFAALKPGLVFEPGRSCAGDVHVADIGIDLGVDESTAPLGVTCFDAGQWTRGAGDPEHNKWDSGLLVIGGSEGMTGAPMLVSHAAMRAGAGIVWCGMPGRETAERASGSEVITKPLPANDRGALSGLGDLVGSIDRFKAIAVGPGLGTAEATVTTVRDLVMKAAKPMVLDADGLNAFAGVADTLKKRPGTTVVTPHDGEYARLMREPVGADRIAAARKLADVTGCVALLKGPTTVIASPTTGRVALNPTGVPQLATAGSGDVLTGIIGGFLAAGADPFDAAASAAYVHGRAAQAAGHTGVVASDLVAALPRVLADPSD